MSWYFLGGFSAYAMDPSARVVNHSGCSFTHGWSGDACSARSSATSMPSSLARAVNAPKSANVPSSGWIASCPPSGEPIAHDEPGSPGGPGDKLTERVPGEHGRDVGALGGGQPVPGRQAAVTQLPREAVE